MVTPFHSRADWGARAPKTTPSRIISEGLTAHYGGDSPWGTSVDRSTAHRFWATADHNRCASIVRAWQAYHMDGKGWNDLAYNAAVCPHGHRYEGRGPGRRSGANGTNTGNDRSEAIVYIAGGDDPLTEEAKRAYHDESDRFARRLRWNHSDWKSTSCAGGPIKTWQSQGWPKPEGDDELSAEDVKKINEKLERLDTLLGDVHLAVYGADLPKEGDNNPRHQSIYTGVKYLRGEVIGGDREDENSPVSIWHRIQDKFRVPNETS